MSRSDREHSIDAEPHIQKESFAPDTSEEHVAERLDLERSGANPDEQRATHSVFDEPTTLPNRRPALIDQDWYCRNCGYNLRGLMTGHACPECGRVERYEPPREGEVTHAQWLADQAAFASTGKSWVIAGVVPLTGLILGLFSGMLTVEHFGIWNFAVIGPIVSEVLKAAGASMVIERRPQWIRRRGQIYIMVLGTAIAFAVVQDLIYLLVFFKSPPAALLVYRWLLGPLLHLLCAAISARGLVIVWERSLSERRPVALSKAYPYLTTAIVVHCVFNAIVYLRGDLGYGF